MIVEPELVIYQQSGGTPKIDCFQAYSPFNIEGGRHHFGNPQNVWHVWGVTTLSITRIFEEPLVWWTWFLNFFCNVVWFRASAVHWKKADISCLKAHFNSGLILDLLMVYPRWVLGIPGDAELYIPRVAWGHSQWDPSVDRRVPQASRWTLE